MRELAASVGNIDHPLLRRPTDENRTNRIALLVLTGVLKPEEAFAGLASISILTIALLLVVSQGVIVARSLADYLKRHPETGKRCSQQGHRDFVTTEKAEFFDRSAALFYGRAIHCRENRDFLP